MWHQLQSAVNDSAVVKITVKTCNCTAIPCISNSVCHMLSSNTGNNNHRGKQTENCLKEMLQRHFLYYQQRLLLHYIAFGFWLISIQNNNSVDQLFTS